MNRFTLLCLVSAAAACTGTSSPSSEPAPSKTPTAAATPTIKSTSQDRTNDPAFALHEVDGKYVGRVADGCPWKGETAPRGVVPPIDLADYKLVGHQLEVQLPFGGCPRWAGYTVVTGHGSPLPFYICHEPQHDTCEMDGRKTWTFDLDAVLTANNATAVTFGIPDGVH